MVYGTSFGGRKVLFTKEESKAMRQFGEPKMEVLGFKPVAEALSGLSVKHSQFLYPDDAIMGGSKTAFVALHRKMIEMDRAMLVRLVTSSGAPRICAVVAKPEVRNMDGGGVDMVSKGR